MDDSTETKSTSESTQQATPWAQSSPWLNQLVDKAGAAGLQDQQFFDGQTYLNQTPEQQSILQNQMQTAGGYQSNFLDPANAAWQDQLAGPDSGRWQDSLNAYADNVWEGFDRNTNPAIRDSFTNAGGRNNSRSDVTRGIAMGDVGNQIARQGAGLALDFERIANQNQQYAMGMTPNMMNWGMQPGNMQYQASQALMQDDQNQLSEDMARHQFDQTQGTWGNISQAFPYIMNPSQAFATNTGTQNSTQTTESDQGWGKTALGIGQMALGGYSGFTNPTGFMGGGSMGGVGGAGNIGMNVGGYDASRFGNFNDFRWG